MGQRHLAPAAVAVGLELGLRGELVVGPPLAAEQPPVDTAHLPQAQVLRGALIPVLGKALTAEPESPGVPCHGDRQAQARE